MVDSSGTWALSIKNMSSIWAALEGSGLVGDRDTPETKYVLAEICRSKEYKKDHLG